MSNKRKIFFYGVIQRRTLTYNLTQSDRLREFKPQGEIQSLIVHAWQDQGTEAGRVVNCTMVIKLIEKVS